MGQLAYCRLCTKPLNDRDGKGLFERHNQALLRQVKDLTGMLLKNRKQLPQSICKACQSELQHAHNFRDRCISAQAYFEANESKKEYEKLRCKAVAKRTSAEKQQLPIKEIYFVPVKKEPLIISDVHSGEESSTLFSSEQNDEADTIMQEDNAEEFAMVGEEDKWEGTSLNKRLIDEHDKETTNLEEQVNGSDQEYEPKKKRRKGAAVPARKTVKQQNAGRKKQNRENGANKKVDKVYICDQCGNNFKCKHHFVTHLQRHTGEKTCQCELCPDKFFTQSELKRHMRKHTGERPFGCQHCDRHFTDYSTRLKHERTHTNDRPFSCPQCEKAFTTSYILKNHMLIHTGERSFKCDLCSKAFQRQTHLLVHYKSLMHQQNVANQANLSQLAPV